MAAKAEEKDTSGEETRKLFYRIARPEREKSRRSEGKGKTEKKPMALSVIATFDKKLSDR